MYCVRISKWSQHEPDDIEDNMFEEFSNAMDYYQKIVNSRVGMIEGSSGVELLIVLDSHRF